MSDLYSLENRRYLGSKAKLLDFIHQTVEEKCGSIHSFADIFGGTGNVGWSFNDKKTKVIVNDFLKSNYLSFVTFFGKEKIDIKKLETIIDNYNAIQPNEDNYFSINFSNTYFSRDNCRKIGYIRDDIEIRYKANELNEREKAYLITSLLYAMDHIANTVGHYDAYRMDGDLNKKLILKMLNVGSLSQNKNNEVYNEDANELVKKIKADVVYIDPPYNSRQYCDAYHLLENVASWNKPDVFGVAKKMKRGKNIKSDYCTQKAPISFDNLIQNINAKYIIVSFNNMGTKGAGRSQSKISDEDIINSLSKRGKVEVLAVEFNQFSAGKTDIKDHQERLFVCEVCDNEYVKSPLNYTGGKFKLLPQLFSLFKEDNTFVDVFGGGFNVGINSNSRKIIYNDKCNQVKRLVELICKSDYEQLSLKIQSVIKQFSLSDTSTNGYEYYGCSSNEGVGKYNKPGYEKLRLEYNSVEDSEQRDILLLVLVFYSFNNQIRFNSKEEFNLPVGKRDYNDSTRYNLKQFIHKAKTKNITFETSDFDSLKNDIDSDCFVYCDPPYYLGVASYNENKGWSKNDEIRLLDFLSYLNKKGIKFALSNLIKHKGKEHDLLINWCKDNNFKVNIIKSNYSNSNYHIVDKSSESIEVLVTNY